MYLFAMGTDFRYVAEYFKLGWTPGAGEKPGLIQIFALGLTLIICIAWALLAFLWKRSPRRADE